MTPERWKQVEELFQAALDLPREERPNFIAEAGAGDDALRQQVEALVAQYEEAGDFIEAPAFAVNGFNPGSAPFRTTQPTDIEDDPMAGARVGAYKIVREIGRGGMGAVYLAVRADSEYQKRVAIKLVKRGMDTDFILRRFRNERQILASLDHTNIARLLDGGTTDTGLPYFVMEYIEGQPLYRYCDGEKLTVQERLRLFVQICNAVAYAHQNLVVHRDIKPSNILICADGSPKLLDFGIAKLLNPELSPDTLTPTATAMRLMTPEYASPEQVRGEAATPASDIYSMGVLLYELLTGHRPYHFPNRSPHEIARVICEEEPEHPSRVVMRPEDLIPLDGGGSETTATLEFLCKLRGTTLENLRRELAGDLDNITLKALRKEPGRRYTSVERLREDIARHLDGRPVSAPFVFPSSAKTSRLATGDAVTGEKTLAVLPFKLLNIQRTEETGENYLGIGLADALITRLSNVRRFSVRPTSSVIRYSGTDIGDPFAAGHELGVSYVVDGRIQRAGERIRITVQLLNVYEGATMWAGQFDENYTDVLSLEDAISAQVATALVPQLTGDEREQLAKRGTDNAEAFEVYLRGRYHWNTFNEEGFAKAITCYYRAIALDPDYAAAYTGIADYYNWIGIYGVMPPEECSAAAKEAGARALELDETLPDAHTAYGFAVHTHDLDWDTPIAHFQRARELNPHHAAAHLWQGTQLVMEGSFDSGLPLVRRALELDPLTLFNQHMLGFCLFYARRFDESLAIYREMIETASMHGLGYFGYSWVLGHLGRHEEAIDAAVKAIEFSGPSPFITATLGSAYAAAGRMQEARHVLGELEELAAKRYVSPYYLAIVYSQLGDYERAFQLLEQSFADREAWIVWLGVQPQFDPLRSDARFAALVRRTKNPGIARLRGEAPRPAQGALFGQAASNSAEIARGVELHLSDNEEARQLYVAGHYFSTRRTADGLRQAIGRFERAVELDPGFAIAYAELADCYALLNWYVEPPPPDAFERARAAAVKAVGADPNLAEAHASLGYIKLHYDHDWAGAEAEFRRAIELRPGNALAHRWYAFALSAVGRHDEAVAEIKRAQQISPESPVIATAVANVLFLARRFDEAVAQCGRALELDPGSVAAHVILRWAYEHRGMREEALAAYEQESVFAGDTPTTRLKEAHVLAACGRGEEAAAILRELLARRGEHWVTAYEIAVIYSLLHDRDNAFHWLAEAESEHAVGFTFAAVDPHLDHLHADPRFAEMLKRTKNPLAARYQSEEAVTRLVVSHDTDDPHLSTLPTLELPFGDRNNGRNRAPHTIAATGTVRRPSWRAAAVAAVLFVVLAAAATGAYFYSKRAGKTAAAANPLRLTTEIAHDWHPDYSPDGQKIAFASNRDGATEIYVMDADGTNVRRLTFNTTEDDCPAWSHDGQKIAFQSRRDGQMEVYVMEADGSNQHNLSNAPGEDTRPSWSPDDRRIAYGSNTLDAPTNYEIFTMRADGSDKIKLTDNSSFDNDASWSPDGQKIAFTSARDGKSYEIFVMNADGSDVRNLTNHPGDDAKPAWSPDGKHITWAGNRPNKTDFPAVYVMDADGHNQRLITAARTFDDEPAWSADGRRVAFQTQRDGNFEIYVTDAFPASPAPSATAADKKMRSLAVLPFSTVGAQGDEQYLGVGIADELTNKLGELDEITLRTSGAVRRYLGANKSAIDAGRELKVDYVLGGWVERVGDRVQTALELTEVAGGRVLWAERFNERFTDISTLQTSISERVVRALSLELTGDERRRLAKHYTENSEAQQLYLAGRYHWGKRTPEGLRQAIVNFEQAIAKDSGFALAYAGLADCYALQNWYLEPPPADAFARAKQSAERAVALDDSLAEAHVSLANAKFHYDRDWQGAAAEFRRAIALNPNYPTAHHWYAFNLSAMERHDDALAEIKRAEELDPRSAVIATAVANVLFHARRFDEAIEQCRKALAMDPGSLPAHIVLRWNYEKKGMTDEALKIYEKERAFAGDTPTTRAKLAHVLAVSGRADESRRILEELVAHRKQQWVTAYEIAVVYALLGDNDNAFNWLDRAEREHAVGYTYLRVDPRLDNLRGDPRYAQLLR
ncbi:MAG: eukaryotic-like serine/threonine-protein kinase [Acidobacteriota bacterium]|nr:eukaryotic-like serine/threonine-protein kinase [Acidobacteriota bacterium]